MNKHALLLNIFLVFCIGFINVCADESKENAPARKTNRESSSSLPDKLLRDPFWEIGWQPETFVEEVKKNEPKKKDTNLSGLIKWKEAEKLIVVAALGTKLDGSYIATLKNQTSVMEKGSVISINYMGLTYRWKILSITSKGILPEKLDVRPIK
ncbi:hypothetical protein ACFLS1_00485 [Verrucomicrobiota bacterium]